MTVLNSGISWTTGTLNLTVGCTKVSDACTNCYAESLVRRGILPGGGDFSTLKFHPKRIHDLRKFAPARNEAGKLEPKMVFVNSLSDFFHEDIPDQFISDNLDAFEQHPNIIIQILTKRPVRMRRIAQARWGNRGVPPHIWLGVSAEDNRVKGRLNILRRLKDQVGDFTAFVSVEPIVAPCDELDFTAIDWVLTGGESGPKARDMLFMHLEQANEKALEAGIPLHFKQYGTSRNNPVVRQLMSRQVSAGAAFKRAVERGLELAPDEKGGATYKGQVIRQKAAHWHLLNADLNRRPSCNDPIPPSCNDPIPQNPQAGRRSPNR
jgi:protein gp37